MRVGSLEFSPATWPTVVTLCLLGVLLALGFWQLDRAEQKRALLARYASGKGQAVLRLEPGMTRFEGLAYQRAAAGGRYDSAHQFLLDNRTHEGLAGYHVLTPLVLDGSNQAVLVDRGWVPVGASRERLPAVAVDEAPRQVRGLLRLPPKRVFMLGDEEPRGRWPYRIQHVDIEALGRELGYPLLPVLLLLDPDEDDGYVRDWRPLHFGPERNIGYAVQWFGLAAALLVIYLVVNTHRIDRQE